MVEASSERSRQLVSTTPRAKEIPVTREVSKPAETAVSIRPTIAMEKHSPEAIKAKKIAKKPLPALWGNRAEFLPATTAFFKNCGIDPERVNPVPMGEGLTNVVFAYQAPDGSSKVVKIAREMRKGFMSAGYEHDADNIALVRKYFGAYAVPTEIRKDPASPKYLILQDAIAGKPVTNKLESQSIRAQLTDLARLNREMMRQTGHSLDFIGVPGFLTWLRHQFRQIITRKSEFHLSNIHVDQHGKLKIIDEGLLRFKNVPFKQWVVANIGFLTNRLIMRLYFGVDLQPHVG